MQKKLFKSFTGLLCLLILCSCGNNKKDIENLGGEKESSSTESVTPAEEASSEEQNSESTSEEQNSESSSDNEYDYVPSGINLHEEYISKIGKDHLPDEFKENNYLSNLSDKITDISEVRKSYAKQASALKETGINNIKFDECVFKDLPEFESVNTYYFYDKPITCAEAWEMVEYWADKIDVEKKLNLNEDVVNANWPADEGEKTGFGIWPLAKNQFDEKTGEWDETRGHNFSFNREDVGYLDITGCGPLCFSYGRVALYYSEKTGKKASKTTDPNMILGGELVKQGSFDELKNEKYELFDGEASVEEAVKKAFDEYYNFPYENVGYDVYYVKIFRVFDKYVYDCYVRRTVDGIPLPWTVTGQRNYYGDVSKYFPRGEDTSGVVCDTIGLDAYYGFREQEVFEKVVSDERKILDLSQAAKRVEEEIAKQYQCKMKTVEFTYLEYEFNGSTVSGQFLLPAWEFTGDNLIDNNHIKIYVDALTGDVCFYELYKDLYE